MNTKKRSLRLPAPFTRFEVRFAALPYRIETTPPLDAEVVNLIPMDVNFNTG